MRVENLETLDKRYDIVYADPPWIQKKGGKKNVRPNSQKEAMSLLTGGTRQDHMTLKTDREDI